MSDTQTLDAVTLDDALALSIVRSFETPLPANGTNGDAVRARAVGAHVLGGLWAARAS